MPAAGVLGLGVAAVAPLVRPLIKNPQRPTASCSTPAGARPTTTAEGTPGAPGSGRTRRSVPRTSSAGGDRTVFPGIPGGATEHADSPTLLIHLPSDAECC